MPPAAPSASRYLDLASRNLALALAEGATVTDVYAVALVALYGGRRADVTDQAADLRTFAEAIR